MWDLPGPGIKPVFPLLAGGFLTTAPPGKPIYVPILFQILFPFRLLHNLLIAVLPSVSPILFVCIAPRHASFVCPPSVWIILPASSPSPSACRSLSPHSSLSPVLLSVGTWHSLYPLSIPSPIWRGLEAWELPLEESQIYFKSHQWDALMIWKAAERQSLIILPLAGWADMWASANVRFCPASHLLRPAGNCDHFWPLPVVSGEGGGGGSSFLVLWKLVVNLGVGGDCVWLVLLQPIQQLCEQLTPCVKYILFDIPWVVPIFLPDAAWYTLCSSLPLNLFFYSTLCPFPIPSPSS